jgi:hypothetical protein
MEAAAMFTNLFVPTRHCEERSDEAIQSLLGMDCFAALAMTISNLWKRSSG